MAPPRISGVCKLENSLTLKLHSLGCEGLISNPSRDAARRLRQPSAAKWAVTKYASVPPPPPDVFLKRAASCQAQPTDYLPADCPLGPACALGSLVASGSLAPAFRIRQSH